MKAEPRAARTLTEAASEREVVVVVVGETDPLAFAFPDFLLLDSSS